MSEELQAEANFIPYRTPGLSGVELEDRAEAFYLNMNRRRSVRHFSDRMVPRKIIENLIMAAASSPSGANKQPYTFCAVSSPAIKTQIRKAAEKEEYENYHGRMSQRWLTDLKPFGTSWHKPFLEIAPWIIVIFKRVYEVTDGEKNNNYYVNESVGMAAGLFVSAVHNAGLSALTHTPSPMNFLGEILQRPENERPFLLIPVGFAADDCKVPNISRKTLEEVAVFY